METIKINQIVDIRQSPQWGGYLESLGWRKHFLGENRSLYSLKTGPLTIAKIQRPADLNRNDIKNLDELAREHNFAFIKLEPSLEQKTELLTQSQYKISMSPLCPPSTVLIDLESKIDNLTKNLSRSAKYSVSRAKREGGKIEFFRNPSVAILEQVFPAYKETTQKQKFMGPSFTDLKTKKDLWGEECHLAVSRNAQKQIQGVNMYLCFNDAAWFIHGATCNEARKTRFGYLLLWESILYLKSLGYKLLDLEGKNDPRFPAFTKNWGGFSHFKERFGGVGISYPHPMIKYYNRALKTLSRLYGFAIPL